MEGAKTHEKAQRGPRQSLLSPALQAYRPTDTGTSMKSQRHIQIGTIEGRAEFGHLRRPFEVESVWKGLRVLRGGVRIQV
jgi:hypothetical protein